MSKKSLSVKIARGVLRIEIGVTTLKKVAENHPKYWQPTIDKTAIVVSDPALFAAEVLRALQDEDEEGTTAVHRLFDAAISAVSESGGEGLDVDAMEAIEYEERAAQEA